MKHQALVEGYLAAMRRGLEAEPEMLALFTADAVYSDPFGFDHQPLIGIEAISDRLRAGLETRPPDFELDVLSVTIEGDRATSTWECRAEAFGGAVRGRDEYRFRDGLIAELHVHVDTT